MDKALKTYYSNYQYAAQVMLKYKSLFKTLKEYKDSNRDSSLSKEIQTFISNTLHTIQDAFLLAGRGPLAIQKTLERLYDAKKLTTFLNDSFKGFTVEQSMLKIAQGFYNSFAKETMPEIKKLEKWNDDAKKFVDKISTMKN